MSKVSITRSLLDNLANTISAKSGVPAPLTLAQMDVAVQSIPTGGGGITISDTTDAAGGTVRTITANGGVTSLVQKSITLNGTFDPGDDEADGYSEVTVNVANGASMSEVPNAYGTELVITSAPGSGPSATRHTIYFEFTDETDATIYAYYDDSFVGDAITATTPTTYDSKTVTLAQLDGVTWYQYTPPTPGQWETLFNDNAAPNADTPYNYFWLSSLSDVYPVAGSTWRITINNTEYTVIAASVSTSQGTMVCVGNPKYSGGTDDGTTIPVCFMNAGWGAMTGDTELPSATLAALKIERLISS